MSGMLKAGLVGLLAGALFGLVITLALPFCTPCAAIVIGLGVGFLACLLDKPTAQSGVAAIGAKAGAIAGAGHLLGQWLGMLLNGLLVGPEGTSELMREFGLGTTAMSPRVYWATQIAFSTSCGLTNIAVAAGLGALGGLLWRQTMGQR
jgi:hypothetical protein